LLCGCQQRKAVKQKRVPSVLTMARGNCSSAIEETRMDRQRRDFLRIITYPFCKLSFVEWLDTPTPASKTFVINEASVDGADLTSEPAEDADAIASAVFVGVSFDRHQLPAFEALDKSAVTETSSGVDHENLSGLYQGGIIEGYIGFDARNALNSGFVPMIEHAGSFDHWIGTANLFRSLLEAEEHKCYTPGEMTCGIEIYRSHVFVHLRTSIRPEWIFSHTNLRCGKSEGRGQQ